MPDLIPRPVKKISRTGGLLLLSLLFFLMIQETGHANDIDRGEALHNEHCLRCHRHDIYERPDRTVDNLPQLQQRVKQCELANELLWFEEEVNDVSAYLNANYYLFGVK